ncbi:MAG TPA: glycosyltransferase [Tepidisphaeraceae bacterium]|nr:glycosyltransferase [Tepidisphaeraceae bacterium]
MLISVITPWLDHPEFIADYERALRAPDVEVIVVDNGSTAENSARIAEMVGRLRGKYIRNAQNQWFAAANNQGIAASTGELLLFLNNDIAAEPGWLDAVRRDVTPNALVGPGLVHIQVDERWISYIEGWCIAGYRSVWEQLGGWDAQAYPMPYWEDGDVCFRASKLGFQIVQKIWPVHHKKNGTTRSMPVRYGLHHNWETLFARVRGEGFSQAQPEKVSIELAAELHRQGRLSEAEHVYLRVLEGNPKEIQAWMLYSQLLIACNRREAAVDVLRQAIAGNPHATELHSSLAQLLGQLGRHDEAKIVSRQATLATRPE